MWWCVEVEAAHAFARHEIASLRACGEIGGGQRALRRCLATGTGAQATAALRLPAGAARARLAAQCTLVHAHHAQDGVVSPLSRRERLALHDTRELERATAARQAPQLSMRRLLARHTPDLAHALHWRVVAAALVRERAPHWRATAAATACDTAMAPARSCVLRCRRPHVLRHPRCQQRAGEASGQPASAGSRWRTLLLTCGPRVGYIPKRATGQK